MEYCTDMCRNKEFVGMEAESQGQQSLEHESIEPQTIQLEGSTGDPGSAESQEKPSLGEKRRKGEVEAGHSTVTMTTYFCCTDCRSAILLSDHWNNEDQTEITLAQVCLI